MSYNEVELEINLAAPVDLISNKSLRENPEGELAEASETTHSFVILLLFC